MTKEQLFQEIKKKRSFLCVGLDSDLSKIPTHLMEFDNPVLEFNKRIIDATKDLCVAYKPNIAFYEMLGSKGWDTLEQTLNYIPSNVFTIADAKRGDIGNTSSYYAKTFFDTYKFDSVTIAPYMGVDSVEPFLKFRGKWAILLALTSNDGSKDFQLFKNTEGQRLFEKVLEKSKDWGDADNLMYVIGATKTDSLSRVREIVPDSFLLIPGVGAQGGNLSEVVKYGMNDTCGLLVNSSRGILYASNDQNFEQAARKSALTMQTQMEQELRNFNLI